MVKDEVTKFTSYKREGTKAFLIKVCHSNYVTFFFFEVWPKSITWLDTVNKTNRKAVNSYVQIQNESVY